MPTPETRPSVLEGSNVTVLWRAVGAFALATAVACTQTEPSCNLAGAESAVSFDFRSVATLDEATSLRATTCVAGDCMDHSPMPLFLLHTAPLTGHPVSVSLRIHSRDGQELFDGVTTVTPRIFEPNGPECPPSVWQAGVVTGGNNKLTQITRGRE